MTRRGRRQFLCATGAIALTAPALAGCSDDLRDPAYEALASEIRRPILPRPVASPSVSTLDNVVARELIRFATLAPSSHNTQCWRFSISQSQIDLHPDFTRHCPVVDPDSHHLYVSLGCAAENLVLAARANGFTTRPVYNAVQDVVQFPLVRATTRIADEDFALYNAIPNRQCARSNYNGEPLAISELKMLARAAESASVSVRLITGKAAMEAVMAYVIEGNTAQIRDPLFIAELKQWIRFSDREAIELRDGLFAGASGSPAVPRWIASPLFPLLFNARSENEKYAKQVRSSSGIAVFVGKESTKPNWIEVGRSYERFALQATTLGVSNAFLNQPVEVPNVRAAFASYLGINERPDLVVRFGRGPSLPRSLRRRVDELIL